jgi:hypothetical protein
MGTIHVSPLQDLALALAGAFKIRDFVETGTFVGHSLAWAAAHFEQVRTIEVREDYQVAARARCGQWRNIQFILGDSGRKLPEVCKELTGPALFWLDAHAGAGYFGPDDCCPLLEEIDAINASAFDHCLLIDDARAFVAPPPPPFDYRKWPTLDEIIGTLLRGRPWHVVAFHDTLICVPPSGRALVADYVCRLRPSI